MVETTTISEAQAFANELKKALEGTDKQVTVNVNINVGERISKKPDINLKPRKFGRLNTSSTSARSYPRVHVDKETGKVTTETVTAGIPSKLSDTTYTTSSGWRDVTHKCKKDIDSSCKCKHDSSTEHIYRPDVNRRNACRHRAARRFEEKRKEMLRNGLADCKITPCKSSTANNKNGAKSYHKKYVDGDGNIITVNYTCNDNPSEHDIAELHRKMNSMLREFPFFW